MGYSINAYGKELTLKDCEESFYNIITRLHSDQGMLAQTDIKIVQMMFKVICGIDDYLGNNLIRLFNDNDFLLLAKCINEKQPFYYEPKKEK